MPSSCIDSSKQISKSPIQIIFLKYLILGHLKDGSQNENCLWKSLVHTVLILCKVCRSDLGLFFRLPVGGLGFHPHAITKTGLLFCRGADSQGAECASSGSLFASTAVSIAQAEQPSAAGSVHGSPGHVLVVASPPATDRASHSPNGTGQESSKTWITV